MVEVTSGSDGLFRSRCIWLRTSSAEPTVPTPMPLAQNRPPARFLSGGAVPTWRKTGDFLELRTSVTLMNFGAHSITEKWPVSGDEDREIWCRRG